MLRVNDRITIPFTEFDFTFARSGGPGGQNVNKVNSKVTLRWNITSSPSLPSDVLARFRSKYHRRMTKDGELVMHSQRYRDQGRNVADCLEKLRELLLEVAVAPRRRKPTRPTKGSVQRRLTAKKQRSDRKQNRRRPNADD